jgi:uroporphyrinogen-III synthase
MSYWAKEPVGFCKLYSAAKTVLRGKGIVVTRPVGQAGTLCALLAEQGAVPITFPTLAIQPITGLEAAQTVASQAERADLLIFISANAVEQVLALLPQGLPSRPKLAVIGKATARALRRAGYEPDFMPTTGNDSEALLALPGLQCVQAWQVLIVRGAGGRETLAETLRARGAKVRYAEVYRRLKPCVDPSDLIARWQRGEVHGVTATSNETLQNLYDLLGTAGRSCLLTTPLVVVSPRAALLAAELGFNAPIQITAEASDQALMDALNRLL